MLNQLETDNYNPNWVWNYKIQNIFLCVYLQPVTMQYRCNRRTACQLFITSLKYLKTNLKLFCNLRAFGSHENVPLMRGMRKQRNDIRGCSGVQPKTDCNFRKQPFERIVAFGVMGAHLMAPIKPLG